MSCRVLQLEEDSSSAITAAAAVLSGGEVVVFPTDTVYGLLAGVGHRAAYTRIYELKQRKREKPLALLVVADGALAAAVRRQLSSFPDELAQFTAGLTTVVMEPDRLPAEALPSAVLRIQPGPVGIRCPRHASLQAVLHAVGGVLWATSANTSGRMPAVTAQQVSAWLETLARPPRLAVLSGAACGGRPSRIVQLADLRRETS